MQPICSGDLKSDHLKSGLFEGQISNGPVVFVKSTHTEIVEFNQGNNRV